MRKAVFLDRDGTVIVDRGYLDNIEGIELLPGATGALKRLQQAGFLLVLVTNQSGIGRGYFGPETVARQHQRLALLLAASGVTLDAIEVCPHSPDQMCDCRKPQPKLLLEAAARFEIDLAGSFMVGDKLSDIEAGLAAGCMTIGIGLSPNAADFCAPDLAGAADYILNQQKRSKADNEQAIT
jgi:D-glycero-D-manno-heptose 1,7-bisphosphate phosphatase